MVGKQPASQPRKTNLIALDGASKVDTEVHTQLVDLASRVTMYRNELIAQGLPRVLVAELVKDYHRAFVMGFDLK